MQTSFFVCLRVHSFDDAIRFVSEQNGGKSNHESNSFQKDKEIERNRTKNDD